MASSDQNLSEVHQLDATSAKGLTFGVVTSNWNAEITTALTDACVNCLREHGASESDIHTIEVPGTFELPLAAKWLAGAQTVDALICIGCVIKGETKHDEYISASVAHAIQVLGIALNKPVIFGVLTPNSMEQARDRAGGAHGNKGVEAAMSAIRMARLSKGLQGAKQSIGF